MASFGLVKTGAPLGVREQQLDVTVDPVGVGSLSAMTSAIAAAVISPAVVVISRCDGQILDLMPSGDGKSKIIIASP